MTLLNFCHGVNFFLVDLKDYRPRIIMTEYFFWNSTCGFLLSHVTKPTMTLILQQIITFIKIDLKKNDIILCYDSFMLINKQHPIEKNK